MTAAIAMCMGFTAGLALSSWWRLFRLSRRFKALLREANSVERDAAAMMTEGDRVGAERCDAYARGLRNGAMTLHYPHLRRVPPRRSR